MKPQIRKQTTKKLFYSKWAFKISCVVKGAHWIRHWGVDKLPPDNRNLLWSTSKLSDKHWNELKNFAAIIKPYITKGTKIRCEGSSVNLYFNDRSLYNNVLDKVSDHCVAVWEPENDNELAVLMDNSKLVIVNQFPHKIYKHRVILKHLPIEKRITLFDWLKKYPSETYKISPITEMYLTGKRIWAQDPFILINDSKMLSMLGLFVNDYIKRTEHFVLRSDINTVS